VERSLSTLSDQIGAIAAALAPMHALIAAHVLAAGRLHGDDTTVPLLAKGKTETAQLWTYVPDDRPFGGRSPPAALFRFWRDRRGEQARQGRRPRPASAQHRGREPAPERDRRNLTVAVGIMAAIGDIARFRSPQKPDGDFGQNPRVRQSGLGAAHHGRISKIGLSDARAMLVGAAREAAKAPPHAFFVRTPHAKAALAAAQGDPPGSLRIASRSAPVSEADPSTRLQPKRRSAKSRSTADCGVPGGLPPAAPTRTRMPGGAAMARRFRSGMTSAAEGL
jgi:hypothetical protein